MDEPDTSQRSTRTNLRHLITFQIKLALDAARDFALSPISIAAFIIDSIRKPEPERSLYHRLMLLGRRSDQIINLFEEHNDADHYTVDETLRGVEQGLGQVIQRGVEEQRKAEATKAKDVAAEPPQKP
jgi:hypothetical protein